MVGESFHHMVAGVRTVTIFRKGATAQKLLRLFAFECGLADPNRQISLELGDMNTLKSRLYVRYRTDEGFRWA